MIAMHAMLQQTPGRASCPQQLQVRVAGAALEVSIQAHRWDSGKGTILMLGDRSVLLEKWGQ